MTFMYVYVLEPLYLSPQVCMLEPRATPNEPRVTGVAKFEFQKSALSRVGLAHPRMYVCICSRGS